jgi:formylglycine-generating enzyme required for sulfatase activity
MRSRYIALFAVLLAAAAAVPPAAGAAGEGRSALANSLGMTFVPIPAGAFVMGSPEDEPDRDPSEDQHRVRIRRPFYMQTTEVTLGQWHALMGKKILFGRKGDEQMPVTRVSWFDTQAFIKKLNARGEGTYRLPTEAEWEYAARAGTTSAYSWGDAIDCRRAMYANSPMKFDQCVAVHRDQGLPVNDPAPVKSYAPNPWGLFDMHGNVWEWCRDWYGPYPKGPQTDPKGPQNGANRVRRGGSWFGLGYICRSANRAYGHPAQRLRTTGFRLVREVER